MDNQKTCSCSNCVCKTNASNKSKITKDMKINDIINNHPETIPILMGYGLSCVGCSYSTVDTLESGAKIHGMDDETIGMIIKDSNAVIEIEN